MAAETCAGRPGGGVGGRPTGASAGGGDTTAPRINLNAGRSHNLICVKRQSAKCADGRAATAQAATFVRRPVDEGDRLGTTGRREARDMRRSTRAVVNYAQYRSHILIYVKRAERAPDQTPARRPTARAAGDDQRRPLPLRRQNDPDDVQPHGQVPLAGLAMASCAPCDGTQKLPLDVYPCGHEPPGPCGLGTGSGCACATVAPSAATKASRVRIGPCPSGSMSFRVHVLAAPRAGPQEPC
jgi:hypothetical protein